MSDKRGDSFEARIAHILNTAGFIIKAQPHRVICDGVDIGDLDVMAEDPNTHMIVGVSCKEWFTDTPGSPEFSHFVEMLEYEHLKYGIFASAQKISDAVLPRLEFTRKQKGINVMLLDYEQIRQLEKWIHSKEDLSVEDYIRSGLDLFSTNRVTITDVIQAKKYSNAGRIVKCEQLIPINFWNESPHYINNMTFSSREATLNLEPYLFFMYSLQIEARHHRTKEVLKEKRIEDIIIVDAVKGKVLEKNDPIFEHIKNFYANAEYRQEIIEKDFTIKKNERRINVNEYIKMLKEKISAENVLKVNYPEGEQNRTVISKAKPDEIKSLLAHLIYVPIWDVLFTVGKKSYKRVYFAYNGDSIIDQMSRCTLCSKNTISICTECGSTACEIHGRACKSCEKILCETCAKICIDCNTSFCVEHKPPHNCSICISTLCNNCDRITCIKCNVIVCFNHRKKCVECSNITCNNHTIENKYMLMTKRFCSNECFNKFETNYKSNGVIGKFKKAIGK